MRQLINGLCKNRVCRIKSLVNWGSSLCTSDVLSAVQRLLEGTDILPYSSLGEKDLIVKSFFLTDTHWFFWQVFQANRDRNTVVSHPLIPPIRAPYVRLHIRSWYRHISIRVELYGCVIGMLAICDYLFVIIYRVNPMLANCTNMSVCKLTTVWNIFNFIVPVKAAFR